MKKNKLTKILLYSVISLVLAGVILLIFSYFGREEEVKKTDSSQKDKKQEQVDRKKEKKEFRRFSNIRQCHRLLN